MNDDKHFRMNLRDEQAEVALLSGLLISGGEALPNILAPPLDFQAEMLWDERHQAAFQEMCRLYLAHEPITFVALDAALGRQHTEYLTGLAGYDLASPVYVPHYAALVRGEWEKRRMVDAASKLVDDVGQGQASLERAIADLARLKAPSKGREMTAAEAIASMQAQEYSGIPTGYSLLDYVTGGFVPTHLWVIDAFTSTGKTAFALNLAANMLRGDAPVLYFSLEQSIEELMIRLISIRSGVGGRGIRLGTLAQEEQVNVAEAEDYYSRAPLTFFDDLYDMSAIEARVEYHSRYRPGGIVILDFLQNLHWQDLFATMSSAITTAQALAKRVGVTMVVLSQISNTEAQQASIGQYYSQKGSGSIRDCADKVLRLKRERDSTELTAYLLKNRQGRSGSSFPLFFHLETGKITETAVEHP